MKNREIIEIFLVNRIYLYELMHTVFGGIPNEELIKIISTEHTSEAFSILSTNEDDILFKMSNFTLGLEEKINDDKSLVDKIKNEYMKLLVGPGRLIAYPWASTYLGKEKMLFQESTLEVRNIYRKYGFITHDYLKVADDHISIELHFMAKMSELVKEAFDNNDGEKIKYYVNAQKEFINKHMLTWIPKYSKEIQKAETAYLYPQFAKAVEAFLNADLEILKNEMFDNM